MSFNEAIVDFAAHFIDESCAGLVARREGDLTFEGSNFFLAEEVAVFVAVLDLFFYLAVNVCWFTLHLRRDMHILLRVVGDWWGGSVGSLSCWSSASCRWYSKGVVGVLDDESVK